MHFIKKFIDCIDSKSRSDSSERQICNTCGQEVYELTIWQIEITYQRKFLQCVLLEYFPGKVLIINFYLLHQNRKRYFSFKPTCVKTSFTFFHDSIVDSGLKSYYRARLGNFPVAANRIMTCNEWVLRAACSSIVSISPHLDFPHQRTQVFEMRVI